MLYDLDNGTIRCKSCGSIRFTVTRTYEAKRTNDSRFEASYAVYAPHTVIKCAECCCVLDESRPGKTIGIEDIN